MPSIEVNLSDRSYEIAIDSGLIDGLGDRVRRVAPHGRAMLVVDRRIAESHGERAKASLAKAGYELVTCELEADERQKSLAIVRVLYDFMLHMPLERGSPVIAVGGGVIGDVAGFAAATYLRGVPLVHVPTTLLAMVDAAIGGKTAVNIELPGGALGKNMIGSFWQPRAVVCDPDVLRTLDERDFRCGMAESIKHAMIGEASAGDGNDSAMTSSMSPDAHAQPRFLAWLEERRAAIMQLDQPTLIELIRRSAAVKAGIVTEDERESGRRAVLNLGHTFAHAIEPIVELDLRHGEAVAIGLCAASHLSCERGLMSGEELASVEAIVESFGLPTRLPQPIDSQRLLAAMQYDKKVAGGRLRLILPRGLGAVEIVDDGPISDIEAAWRSVGAG